MPPHTGTTLGAELYDLWVCARVKIPEVAEAYLDANKSVARTSSGDRQAFIRGVEDHTGKHDTAGQVYPHWRNLRDEFQNILADTVENLTIIGDTLEAVVKLYASTDEAAAQELQMSVRGRNHDPNLKDGYKGDIPSPVRAES
ncbi:MAG: hypothetical protein ACRDTQ_19950 [Micromonosporaceae bacterium]